MTLARVVSAFQIVDLVLILKISISMSSLFKSPFSFPTMQLDVPGLPSQTPTSPGRLDKKTSPTSNVDTMLVSSFSSIEFVTKSVAGANSELNALHEFFQVEITENGLCLVVFVESTYESCDG